MVTPSPIARLIDIFWVYLRLGCISFGGPVAHLGYFREEFVRRRRWLDDARYAELLGLCQFVPGPSSSQLGFAIGWHRAGLVGAFAAWLGFTLPSALIMIGCAYGLSAFSDAMMAPVRGLLIAAVAVVAQAILGLGNKLCPDLPRLLIALAATMLTLALPSGLMQIAAIALGVLLGQFLSAPSPTPQRPTPSVNGRRSPIARVALTVYATLLTVSLVFSETIYAVHYTAGALVFGGGQVVLPLLNDGIVGTGFLSEAHFLVGYSAAQALPGPLFTLSAFLGTAGGGTAPAFIGGLLALVAIFLPGLLLLLALLPFWNRIRTLVWAHKGLLGANAAVVGLLLAAFIDPVWLHGIQSPTDFALGLVAFIALRSGKVPPWAVVLSCGLFGWLAL